jgi:hypothetical protein
MIKAIMGLALLFMVMFFCQSGAAQTQKESALGQAKLEEILAKTKTYCHRLENAAIDFVCVEAVSEIIDNSKDMIELRPDLVDWRFFRYLSKVIEKNSYVFDYQFIRRGTEKIEKRILIEENGKKIRKENAVPMTSVLRVRNVLFGPVGLLGPARQYRYEFRIVGEGSFNGQKSDILETIPRFTVDQSHCFGRIWVGEGDSSVLKIEWDPKSIGNYYIIEATAKRYNAEPRFTSISEYGLEKNGIRFPTRDMTEEAYIMANGKKFVRATTTVLYKSYKFFTVETDVKF